jgi:hypothetical protein
MPPLEVTSHNEASIVACARIVVKVTVAGKLQIGTMQDIECGGYGCFFMSNRKKG